ncbi:MAG TPA: HEAT repeat domain-containing protein [Pyrinomonadaceae bacterium]|nr:HEAT repeat domain-containing protein [Pyrinomonadaceae bacterium]
MSKTNRHFISVDGDDLQVRLAAAQRAARAASRHRYWAAYKFPVLPNVSIDAVSISSIGVEMQVGIITGNVGELETRSLGVFLSYGERETEPSRVEIYNLDRKRDYEGWPVYWLGEVEASESLTLLGSLVRRTKNEMVGGKLVEAISVHESPQVEELLTELTRSSPLVAVRGGAVFCLGRFGHNLALVEEVAGNRREHIEVRRQAIMAIGRNRWTDKLDALRRLLNEVEEPSLRQTIVNLIAKSRHPDANELLKILSERTGDAELSRHARQLMLGASGARSRIREVKRRERARPDRSWRFWK